MRGVIVKQTMPIIITRFLLKRSEKLPKGMEKRALATPEAEPRTPITIKEAPRATANEGKIGMTTLWLASMKKIEAQRARTPASPLLSSRPSSSLVILT